LSSGRLTESWEDSVSALLDKFVLKDTRSEEGQMHADIRRKNLSHQNMNIEPLITVNEVLIAIKRIKNKKPLGRIH